MQIYIILYLNKYLWAQRHKIKSVNIKECLISFLINHLKKYFLVLKEIILHNNHNKVKINNNSKKNKNNYLNIHYLKMVLYN